MSTQKMVTCVRCQGTQSVLIEKLHDFELRKLNLPEDANRKEGITKWMRKTDYALCPICPEFGPFGLVPEAYAIDGALRGVAREERELADQKTKDWWLREMFRDVKPW